MPALPLEPLEPLLPLVPELPEAPPVPLVPALLCVPPVDEEPLTPAVPAVPPELPELPPWAPPVAPSSQMIPGVVQISSSSESLTSTPVAHATLATIPIHAPHAARRLSQTRAQRAEEWGGFELKHCRIASFIPQPDPGGSPLRYTPHFGRHSRAACVAEQRSRLPSGRDAADRSVRERSNGFSIRCVKALAQLGLSFNLVLSSACNSGGRPPPPASTDDYGRSGSGGSASTQQGNGGSGSGAGGGAGSFNGGGGSASSGAGAGGAGMGGSSPFDADCTPREDCLALCAAVGSNPSACGLGEPAQCACACEQRFRGPCPDELAAVVACAGDAPSIDCAERGRIFPGCEAQSVALELCDFRAREQLCAQAYPRCLAYCQPATLSFCPQGPATVSSCLCGCEATLIGNCETQFDAFMACAADAPSFSCDSNGREVPASCLAEWQTLQSCASGTPDAGN